MKKIIFEVEATALVTPMNSDGSVNYTALEDLVEEQINNGIDALVTAGTNAKNIAKRAKELGIECIHSFDTTEEAAEFAKEFAKAGDCVLIKASHGMHFEKIVDSIIGE